jgi:hypothetical protein
LALPVLADGINSSADLVPIKVWIEDQTDEIFGLLALGPDTKNGSDKWFDKMMNFDIERNAIERFKANMWKQMEHLSEEEKEILFIGLTKQWMSLESLFCLGENGCKKYLEIQPEYEYYLGIDDGEPWMTPTDLRQFGDQARSFIRANLRVGSGLLRMYQNLGMGGVGSVASIVSPFEEYVEKYGSSTDVQNVNVVVGEKDGNLIVKGQYWMFDRILTMEQRRFLHNAAYTLSFQEKSDLSQVDIKKFADAIPIDRLLVGEEGGVQNLERELLVMHPNVFNVSQLNGTDYLREFFSQAYEQKFGEKLFNDIDLSMYPVIHELVNAYLPLLYKKLWVENDKAGYYDALRTMMYHCQAIYSLKKSHAKGIRREEAYFSMRMDLNDILDGRIMVGLMFEASGGDLLSNNLSNSSLDTSIPMGFESINSRNYCHIHEYWHSGSCPKCTESKKLLAKAEDKKRK